MLVLLLVLSIVANLLLGVMLWINSQRNADMKEEIEILLEQRQFDMNIPEEEVFRRIF